MANMLILAFVTLLPAGRDLFARAALDHALYAALAIIVTSIAAVLVLVAPAMTVVGVGPGSLLLLAVYLVGTRAIFRHTIVAQTAGRVVEMSGSSAEPATPARDRPAPGEGSGARVPLSPKPGAGQRVPTLRTAVVGFLGAAVLILLAAPRFAHAANDLAIITGMGSTFVGTWLVGLSTSLPELVASIAAVRLGAHDLAVGNLFGSNALNMSIFVVLDAVHGGPVLSAVDPAHVISALVAIALMGTGLAALVYRAKRRFAFLEPSGAAMLLTYIAGLALVYAMTRS
jgi:cation:H+ antiporter